LENYGLAFQRGIRSERVSVCMLPKTLYYMGITPALAWVGFSATVMKVL
jgi:hypothetical protein